MIRPPRTGRRHDPLAGEAQRGMIVTSRRARARWYTTKTEPSYDDMAVKLRRVIIAPRFRPPCPEQATPQETRAVLAAWAAAET